ncbi:hypothetical protein N658DRAFT_504102 [Parathielavia hyrcaniae]|uniref:Uncharacterized protein n=1 Tax=Parathielavia hyrcaniae TaxID=113614 RepID=A0AAN6T515_9PEZI|nr:hypothetical protein N658DRAFT_504102 [Parathielavia hyrcaniae]
MVSTKMLVAAVALVLQVSAIPAAMKRQDAECSAEYTALVLNGDCVGGHLACEFCCPPNYDAEATVDHCHPGHAPHNCNNGYKDFHR